MNFHTLRPALALAALLSLPACVDRAKADAKLARGCAAGIEQFLPEGSSIKEIKERIFGESDAGGSGARYVTLKLVETDGWADVDKEYRCIFQEQFGFLGTGYVATIYQVRMDDKIYGKDGDKILGSFEDHLKLTEAVDKALNALGE